MSTSDGVLDANLLHYISVTVGLITCAVGQNEIDRHQHIPMHTSIRTGHMYMLELLNEHPDRLFNMIRMYKPCFEMLIRVLKQEKGLDNTRNITLEEQVLIFLFVVSQKATNRMAMEGWQHSSSTISVIFTRICKAICGLSNIFINPPNLDEVPEEIKSNPNYFPYFKDCVGAIDGSHITAHAPSSVANTFRGRKSNVTQNMMAVCSFNMLFTYVVTGWEGSVHDSKVLETLLEDPTSNFPHPPPGKYYLVDSGYSNKPGYLAPFRRHVYHLKDTRRRRGRFREAPDLYNYRHASLRNCIKRCFGVLKARFPILRFMTNFSLIRQREIAMACCVLHNFIRMHNSDDPLFHKYDQDGCMPDDEDDEEDSNNATQGNDPSGSPPYDETSANDLRDQIMFQMWNQYNPNDN